MQNKRFIVMYRVDPTSTSSLFYRFNVISAASNDPSTFTVLMVTPRAVTDFSKSLDRDTIGFIRFP